jgi:Arc/MetJ-type ribon-helix-helix transcriptional regulator
VKHGGFEDDSAVVREAVRRMKAAESPEPATLQRAMDQAEESGFAAFKRKDWEALRRLAKAGA